VLTGGAVRFLRLRISAGGRLFRCHRAFGGSLGCSCGIRRLLPKAARRRRGSLSQFVVRLRRSLGDFRGTPSLGLLAPPAPS